MIQFSKEVIQMAIGEDKTRIILTLKKEVKETLDRLAQEDNRSTSNYLQNLVDKHLKEMEEKQ